MRFNFSNKKSGIVIKNDHLWQGHPDVAFFQDMIYVVFRESNSHRVLNSSAIKCVKSSDGIVFSKPQTILRSDDHSMYNCPRLSVIDDKLYLTCDHLKDPEDQDFKNRENNENNTSIRISVTEDGNKWSVIYTNIKGIVPDRIFKAPNGTFLIGSHSAGVPNADSNLSFTGRLLSQYVWSSNCIESEYWDRYIVESTNRHLCAGSICKINKGEIICMMRENSGLGLPAFVSRSSDSGKTWVGPLLTRFFGCHRPTLGRLRSGRLLVTYREQVFSTNTGYWGKNTVCCLSECPVDSYDFKYSVLLPLDHDTSPVSDSGYTGWVQLPDGSIYIVNYITNDAPKAYIKWYIIREKDFTNNL